MCSSPIHVTASQLISSEIFPLPVVKALLYPGAIVNGFFTNMTFQKWNDLLSIYNLNNIKEASAVVGLQRLELLLCRWFPRWPSKTEEDDMFGTLLVIWSLLKEGILGKPPNTMLIALLCDLWSVKYNLKKAVRNTTPQPAAKPLKSASKSKLK